MTPIRTKINHIPSVSPGQWSPCHLCGRSACFLSAQSNAVASSWLTTSVVSWASRPLAASPWTWRSAASPGQGLPLQVSHSWIVLPNTRTKQLETFQDPQRAVSHSEQWNITKTSVLFNCCKVLPLFDMNMHQPIKVERPAQHRLFLFTTFRLKGNCWSELTSFLWKVHWMQLWFFYANNTAVCNSLTIKQ